MKKAFSNIICLTEAWSESSGPRRACEKCGIEDSSSILARRTGYGANPHRCACNTRPIAVNRTRIMMVCHVIYVSGETKEA